MCHLSFGRAVGESEIEGDAHLLKQLLVLAKIFVSQLVEAAVLLKLFEERVHLLAQLIISLPDPDSPYLALKRFQDCFRRLLMALPKLENRNLVVNHAIRFSLGYLSCAGLRIIEDEDLRVVKMLNGVDMAGGGLLYRHADVWLVDVIYRLDRAIFLR